MAWSGTGRRIEARLGDQQSRETPPTSKAQVPQRIWIEGGVPGDRGAALVIWALRLRFLAGAVPKVLRVGIAACGPRFLSPCPA